MRKPLLTIACLLVCIHVIAQNWQPFMAGETHHFHSDTVIGFPDQSIEVDSITGTAVDSVWHFNRFFTPVDHYQAIKNVPGFCQRKMRIHADGWIQMFDPGNIAVHAIAPLGETWLLDSLHGYTGLVDMIWADSVLGVADSLKRILLSSGDTMILSKAHGLVQWPASLRSRRYELSGLQMQHLGEVVPDFDSIFHYQPGQILCWLSQHAEYDLVTYYDNLRTKMVILSTVRDANGLKVYFQGIRQYSGPSFPIWDPGIPFALDSFYVEDAPGAITRLQHREQVDLDSIIPALRYPGNWDFTSLAAGIYDRSNPNCSIAPEKAFAFVERTAGSDTLRLGAANIAYLPLYHATGTDTLDGLYVGVRYLDVVCKAPIGLERLFVSGIEFSANYHVVGYTTASGDTVGTLWEDSFLLANALSMPLMVSLHPQPANVSIQFTLPNADAAAIEVLNLQGQVLNHFEFASAAGEIDVHDLPAGMYLLRFSQGGALATKRIAIQH